MKKHILILLFIGFNCSLFSQQTPADSQTQSILIYNAHIHIGNGEVIENGSIGLSYTTSKKTALYFGTNIGHVSNFDTQDPNNGYSFLGFEVGVSYKLK